MGDPGIPEPPLCGCASPTPGLPSAPLTGSHFQNTACDPLRAQTVWCGGHSPPAAVCPDPLCTPVARLMVLSGICCVMPKAQAGYGWTSACVLKWLPRGSGSTISRAHHAAGLAVPSVKWLQLHRTPVGPNFPPHKLEGTGFLIQWLAPSATEVKAQGTFGV